MNPVNHEISKHISIKYHFIREAQEKGEIQLHYCQTGEQLADIFTKALPREKFCYLRERIGVIKQMHCGGVLELMHQRLVFRNYL